MRNSYVVVDGKGSPTTQLSSAEEATASAAVVDVEERAAASLARGGTASSSRSSSRSPNESRRILKNTSVSLKTTDDLGILEQVHRQQQQNNRTLKRRETIEVRKRRVILRILGRDEDDGDEFQYCGGDSNNKGHRRRCFCPRRMHPTLLMILVTALLTLSSTVLLNVSILTDRWETVSFDEGKIEAILAARNLSSDVVQWLFDGRVGVFLLSSSPMSAVPASSVIPTSSPTKAKLLYTSNTKSTGPVTTAAGNKKIAERSLLITSSATTAEKSADIVIMTTATDAALSPSASKGVDSSASDHGDELGDSFFVPMHGGVWKMCPDLSASELEQLSNLGYWLKGCLHHMEPGIVQRSTGHRDDWAQRMQNLSISCAMVCLILLGASAVVGFVGVCRQEIPAVLVTGILYLLACIFGVFTLTIMHFKRRTKRDFGVLDQYLSSAFYPARNFDSGWSFYVGWAGVGLCFLASVLWLVLARVMRVHILTASIS